MFIERHLLSIGNDVKLMCTNRVHAMRKIYIKPSWKKGARTHSLRCFYFCTIYIYYIFCCCFASVWNHSFSCRSVYAKWTKFRYGNWFHEIAVINFHFDNLSSFPLDGRIQWTKYHISNGTKCVLSFIIIAIFFFFHFVCVWVDFMAYSRKVHIKIAKCGMSAQTIA